MTLLSVRAALFATLILCTTATATSAQLCGDADGNGQVTVTDGVNVLRAAAGLSTTCTQNCDVNGDGSLTVTDGVNVLRIAAGLQATASCAVDPVINSVESDGGIFGTFTKIPGGLVAPPGAVETVSRVAFEDSFVSGRVNTVTVEYDVGGALAQAGAADISLLIASSSAAGAASPGFYELPLDSGSATLTIALDLRGDLDVQQFRLSLANGSGGSVIGQVVTIFIVVLRESPPRCGNRVLDPSELCDPPGFGCAVSSDPGFCDAGCACQPFPGPRPTLPPPTCPNDIREPGEQCDGQDASPCGGLPCRADCTCAPAPTPTPTFTVAPTATRTVTPLSTPAAQTVRVSVSSSGEQTNGPSGGSGSIAISSDGRFVAFDSGASNLVPGDTNNQQDIFVHDRQTAITSRVSVSSAGAEGNGQSVLPALSNDGRFVAFQSTASTLVPGASLGVYVHDRQTATTTRASVNSSGMPATGFMFGLALAGDGRFVAFDTDATNIVPSDPSGTRDVFVHDRQTGTTTRVGPSSSGTTTFGLSLSEDGRFVAFISNATDIVPGDTNGAHDVFVHDRQTATTTRVSVSSSGAQANGMSERPALSRDGRFVAFSSVASNLVPNDTNGTSDVFVHDRQTGTTTLVSVSSAGVQGSNSFTPALSDDGRFVAFSSLALSLVPADTNNAADIFVHDRQTGTTTRASVSSTGAQANSQNFSPALSSDGGVVAFNGLGSNLVPGDTNGTGDIFVRDLIDVP